MNVSIEKLRKTFPKSVDANQFHDRSDPAYTGPGTWNRLTQSAAAVKNHNDELGFEKELTTTCIEFPCGNCSSHCQDYIKNNPISDYYGKYIVVERPEGSGASGGEKILIGMFMYIWTFHNVVNKRLNKPQMSWDAAFNMFYHRGDLACNVMCEAAAHTETPKKTKIKMVNNSV